MTFVGQKYETKNVLSWCIINFVVLICAYFGFYENMQWGKNIVMFFTWLSFIVYLLHILSLSNPETYKYTIETGPPVPMELRLPYNTFYVILYVCVGYFWLAGVQMLVVTFICEINNRRNKYLQNKSE